MTNRVVAVFSLQLGFAGCSEMTPAETTTSGTSGDTGTTSVDTTSTGGAATTDTAETAADVTSSGSTEPAAAVCGDGVVEGDEQCDGEPVAGVECPRTCGFEPKTELWATLVDVHGLTDDPFSVDVGVLDEIYVAGLTTSGETFSDPLLMRVSDAGAVEWIDATVIAPGAGARALHFGVSASAEAVYVTGGFNPLDDANMQIRTARHALDGALVWERVYAGPIAAATYEGHAIEVLSDGSVLVVGVETQDGLTPAVVLRYSSEGRLLGDERVWAPPWDEELDQSDVHTLDLALDPSATAYVISGTATTPLTIWDGWLQKRSMTDETQWERLATGPRQGGDFDSYYAVTVDVTGNVIAVGVYDGGDRTGDDIWVHKYDANGSMYWSAEYAEPNQDRAHGVVTDPSGNIFVHGNFEDPIIPGGGGDIDLWLRKYDPDGRELWTDVWDGFGGPGSYDYASQIAIDSRGFLVVAAKTMTETTDYDVLVRKVAP